jgi:hypothetical protein
MIATTRISRYTSYAKPKAIFDPFAPDVSTEQYRGCSIIVEQVSSEFIKAHVLNPSGKPIGELSTASTIEAVVAAAKMLVDQGLMEVEV